MVGIATDPFNKLSTSSELGNDDHDYFSQFKEFLTRYYVGISDFRGKGKLVEQGLPPRIERELSLKGIILAIELVEGKIFLASVVKDIKQKPKLKIRMLDKVIIEGEFIFLDDASQEKFTIKLVKEGEKDEKKEKLIVLNGNGERDLRIDPKKIVVFYNNLTGTPDQIGLEFWLKRLKGKLDYIEYDAKRSRKKLGIFSPGRIDEDDWVKINNGLDGDEFAVNIAMPKSQTGKGKHEGFDPNDTRHLIHSPANSKERTQLWDDYRQYKIELATYHGVMLAPSFKQERQNIPETMAIEASYRAWEKDRKHVREIAYQQCEELGWVEKGWELNYGANAETNEQKIKKVEEEIKLLELEEKLAELKEQLAWKKTATKEEKKIEIVHERKK